MSNTMPHRTLYDTLLALREIVPAQYHPEIDRQREALLYKAPEQERECWDESTAWLARIAGFPDRPPFVVTESERWKAEALALWACRDLSEMVAAGHVVIE